MDYIKRERKETNQIGGDEIYNNVTGKFNKKEGYICNMKYLKRARRDIAWVRICSKRSGLRTALLASSNEDGIRTPLRDLDLIINNNHNNR